MIRFVVDPEGGLMPDLAARLPGRGIWLRPDRQLWKAPGTRQRLARVGVRRFDPDALAGQLERLLERRCLDLLGLARRAGQLAAGYEKVREALAEGRVAMLLVARDASENGRRRFRDLPPGVCRAEPFDRAALGRAIGRDAVVYVAVAPGRLAERLRCEIGRLLELRGRRDRDPGDGRGKRAGTAGTTARDVCATTVEEMHER